MSEPEQVVQIDLEQLGRHSWVRAVLGAAMGSGGGPPYRFAAAPDDPGKPA